MKGLGWTKFRTGLAGVLLLASVVHAEAVSQNSGGHTGTAQNYTNPKQSDEERALTAVQSALKSVSGALIAEEHKGQSPEEKEQARRNLAAQEEIAFWAPYVIGLGVVDILVTIVGVIVVWLTLGETRRSGQAQTKAYLSCTSGTYIAGIMDGGDLGSCPYFMCKIVFKNFGQSPAQNPWTKARLEVWTGGKSYLFWGDGYVPTVAAGQTETGGVHFEEIPQHVYDAIRQDQFISIVGDVYWLDVFGKTNTIFYELNQLGTGNVVVRPNETTFEGSLRAENRADATGFYEAQDAYYKDRTKRRDT